MDRFNADMSDFASDAALMRRLAGPCAPRGTARLGLGRGELRRLEARLAEIRRLRREGDRAEWTLARLDGQGRVAEARARQALAEGGDRLPAWRGRPRIEVALEALCAEGELTQDRLLFALAELDAAQPMTMAELWAVPEALRTVLSRGLSDVAKAVVGRARDRADARRWVRDPSGRLEGRDATFLSHALRCAGEEGLPTARRRLDEALARRGLSAEALAARAQTEEAAERMRLENLLATGRMLDGLNWRDCFEALSRVERELRDDPSGVYPRMDEPSREAVRREVAHIARRTGLPETVVARCAADAARMGSGERGGVCWWLYDDEGRRAFLQILISKKAFSPEAKMIFPTPQDLEKSPRARPANGCGAAFAMS